MRYNIKLGLKFIYNSLKFEPGRPDEPGFDPENQMEKWSRNWPRTGLTRDRGSRFTHSIFDLSGRNPRTESTRSRRPRSTLVQFRGQSSPVADVRGLSTRTSSSLVRIHGLVLSAVSVLGMVCLGWSLGSNSAAWSSPTWSSAAWSIFLPLPLFFMLAHQTLQTSTWAFPNLEYYTCIWYVSN